MIEMLTRFRLLPLLVLVAMAAFAVRVGEAVTDVRDITASALAQNVNNAKASALGLAGIAPAAGDAEDAEEKEDADEKASEKKAEPQPSAAGQPAAVAQQPKATPNVALPDATLPEVWADPAAQEMADSPEQMRLLEDLAKRRQQLEAREKALDTRDALMKATEKQINAKLGELTSLKEQIEKLLGQQEEQEDARIISLVKIYEGMKPKDAAAIFNQMDMAVLLQVISRMSERKSAPIVASMDRARANELTVRLTEMKKLPEQKKGFQGASGTRPAGPTPTTAPAGSAPLPGLDALGAP